MDVVAAHRSAAQRWWNRLSAYLFLFHDFIQMISSFQVNWLRRRNVILVVRFSVFFINSWFCVRCFRSTLNTLLRRRHMHFHGSCVWVWSGRFAFAVGCWLTGYYWFSLLFYCALASSNCVWTTFGSWEMCSNCSPFRPKENWYFFSFFIRSSFATIHSIYSHGTQLACVLFPAHAHTDTREIHKTQWSVTRLSEIKWKNSLQTHTA